ncbi:hypothetical protein AB0G00_13455 [Nocardia salmonicida]|uniref:hypothetical protein n=1 Tax=Nocardia salmonicida TaxID=53431 RepID=UPI0034042CEB
MKPPAEGSAFGVGEQVFLVGCTPSSLFAPVINAVAVAAAVGWLDSAWLIMPEGRGWWGATLAFGFAGLVYVLLGLVLLIAIVVSPVRIYVGGLSEIVSNVLKVWMLVMFSEWVGFGVGVDGWWTFVWAGVIIAAVRFVFGARTSFDG